MDNLFWTWPGTRPRSECIDGAGAIRDGAIRDEGLEDCVYWGIIAYDAISHATRVICRLDDRGDEVSSRSLLTCRVQVLINGYVKNLDKKSQSTYLVSIIVVVVARDGIIDVRERSTPYIRSITTIRVATTETRCSVDCWLINSTIVSKSLEKKYWEWTNSGPSSSPSSRKSRRLIQNEGFSPSVWIRASGLRSGVEFDGYIVLWVDKRRGCAFMGCCRRTLRSAASPFSAGVSTVSAAVSSSTFTTEQFFEIWGWAAGG